VWFLLLVALGALMTSTIRYYSFKDVPWARKQPSITIIVVVMLVAIAWRYSEYVLVIFAGTYAVAGIFLHVLRTLRHRAATRTA
jgi:phosphatidylserine synthase